MGPARAADASHNLVLWRTLSRGEGHSKRERADRSFAVRSGAPPRSKYAMDPVRDLVHILAEHAASVQYDVLPAEAREAAKKSILDTLGVSLAASSLEPAARGVIDIVRESGGALQCSLLGFGGRYPALSAALGNGAL